MDFRKMDIKASMEILTTPDLSDEILVKYLKEVNENISALDQKNEHIVSLILKLNWTERSESLCRCYYELVLNLVTAYNMYLRSVLKMIINGFIPVPGGKGLDICPYIHQLLKGIVSLIPSAPDLLLPMLAENFPYMRKSAEIQICYLKNLFHLTLYLPAYRPALLELIITKLLQIDVHCPRDVIIESEDFEEAENDEKPGTIFEMESEGLKDEMKHPLANTLDLLINNLFQFVNTTCLSVPSGDTKDKLNWESTKKIYRELLTVFDAIILPTHACAHIQFVLFYVCSLRNLLCEGFVDYLWKKVQNPNFSPVIRQASACYMGSLLARAKFVPISMVQDCLKLMCYWINSYIDIQSGSSQTYVDAVHHSTFYAICQVVFYLVTFRHKEMVNHKKGRQLLLELNIERIVNCRLNPLRICLPVVVKNFASVARNYQIAYCYTIMERNARLFFTASNNQSCTDVSSFTTLETFFPFDPYLLKRSGKIIEPLYRQYEGHQAEESRIEEMEEQDFLLENMELGSPQVHSLLPDLLHHSTSPGFRQHQAPKLR